MNLVMIVFINTKTKNHFMFFLQNGDSLEVSHCKETRGHLEWNIHIQTKFVPCPNSLSNNFAI